MDVTEDINSNEKSKLKEEITSLLTVNGKKRSGVAAPEESDKEDENRSESSRCSRRNTL